MPAATPADGLMKPAPISKLKLGVDDSMSEPGWDKRDACMRRMLEVGEGTSQRFRLCACSQADDLGQTTLPFTN